MKAVILAGGRGTRLAEETHRTPKPLVEAAGDPLLLHIMKNYARHGISEFVVLAGFKGDQIRRYFADFWLHQTDITFDLSNPSHDVHEYRGPSWKVTVLDTGLDTMTGGRLKQVQRLIDGPFLATYGDGVSDVDITKLLEFHKSQGKKATLTAMQPPARFGALDIQGNDVKSFQEKPHGEGALVNGGFFVIEPEVLELISGNQSVFEDDVLPILAQENQLAAYRHNGFWQPVDTIRDLQRLEEALSQGLLPWA